MQQTQEAVVLYVQIFKVKVLQILFIRVEMEMRVTLPQLIIWLMVLFKQLQGGYPTRWGTFGQLLYNTFLRRYCDSRVPRPIYGNKRRFPRGPVCRILSLEPELFIVDSSRRPSREARARARAPRARGACNFSK